MPKNRRRAERYKAKLFIELESIPVGRGVVIDLSKLGFAVDTEADLSTGYEYECHIEIPVTVKARVVRRLSEGQIKRYGMEFVHQSLLDKFVFRRLITGPKRTRKL